MIGNGPEIDTLATAEDGNNALRPINATVSSDGRDPVFAELDASIKLEEGARKKRGNQRNMGKRSPTKRGGLPAKGPLYELTKRFMMHLVALYPDQMARSPREFRERILRYIKLCCQPYAKRGGAPKKKQVTIALAKYDEQRERIRGKLKSGNWHEIALMAIPGYIGMREGTRTLALDKLRNSVYKRRKSESQGFSGEKPGPAAK